MLLPRRATIEVGLWGLLLAVTIGVPATADSRTPRLDQRDPFDLLLLTNEAGGAKLQIFPIDVPDRKLKRGGDSEQLRVRVLAYPDREFHVRWRDIRTVILFEDLLLKAAKRLAENGRLEQAFQHLERAWKIDPKRAGLHEAAERLMMTVAKAAAKDGRLVEAWGTLDFVVRQRPDSPAPLQHLLPVVDQIFANQIKTEKFADARGMIDRLVVRYGAHSVRPTTDKWEQRLQLLSNQYLSRALEKKSDTRVAMNLVERAIELWPASAKANALFGELVKLRPRVIVGVTRAASQQPTYWNEWSARRVTRLQQRRISEVIGIGSDGARYEFPLGKFQIEGGGTSIAIELDGDNSSVVTSGISGHDVAEVLIGSLREGNASYFPLWHQVVRSISVPSPLATTVGLSRPMLRTPGLLNMPLAGDMNDPVWGQFVPYETLENGRFRLNESYVLRNQRQPIEIIERVIPGKSAAMELRRGAIHVADRLSAVDVELLRNQPGVYVRRYAFPSIHFLLPNTRDGKSRRITSDRNFRRALVYAINRRTILEQVLLRGRNVEGCQLISGPLAPGNGKDDPMAYAYDPDIAPRDYDPILGATLAGMARRDLKTFIQKTGGEAPEDWPPLVLAHPDDELCRTAAATIASYLNAVNLQCTLKQLAPGQVLPEQGEPWDLLYVDTVMSEPLIDLYRLFGEAGLLGSASPYFQSAIQRLTAATVWSDARDILREIHRVAHDEVTVIPLWQWADFYAHRSYVQGVRRDAVSLYQDVERWTVQPESRP